MLLIYLLGFFVCPPTQFIVFHFFLKTILEISNNNGIFNTRILLMIFNFRKISCLTFIIINIALTNVLRAFGVQYGVLRYLKLASQKLI